MKTKKTRFMKLFAAVIAAALLLTSMFAFGACSKKGLTIGITIYAPMNYYDEDHKLIGFDTEFAEKACAELGYTPKFQVIDWDNKVNELQSGTIDLIWNGMTISDELKENIAISDPYMENRQVVVTKAANASKFTDITSISQAASIAVESGSAGETVAKENGYESKLHKMGAQSDCLLEVKTGTSEIAIIDSTMATAMTGEGTDYSDLVMINVGFETENYGIGMRKSDTQLLKDINDIIKKFKENGTLDELTRKYFAA